MGSHVLLLLLYIRTYGCVRNLCYAFRNSPRQQSSILELAFSKTKIRRFSKASGRLSATWNTNLLDLLFTVMLFLIWIHLYYTEGLHLTAFIIVCDVDSSASIKCPGQPYYKLLK